MPTCEICESPIRNGRYCRRCAREQNDEGVAGGEIADRQASQLAVDDLELARADYEYQAKHADDVQERNFYQRHADQLAEGIESLEGSA